MSVLVKGMTMPYGCANCPFCSGATYDCHMKVTYSCEADVDGRKGRNNTNQVLSMYDGAGETFPDWCPLEEVDEWENHTDELAGEMRDYCEHYEPTYNPEDGGM